MKTTKKKHRMKKRTKIILWSVTGLLALGLAGGGYFAYETLIPHKVPVDKQATVSTNFYQAINKSYLEKTQIPKDQATQGAFFEIQNDIDKQLQKDLDRLASGKETSSIIGAQQMTAYYKLATDSKKIDKAGTKPAQKYLKTIEDLESIDDFNQAQKDLMLKGIALPYGIGLSVDQTNTSRYLLTYSEQTGILPDVSLYSDKAQAKYYFDAYTTAATAVMKDMGYSDKDAQQMVKDTIALDKKLAKHRLSTEAIADTDNTFNKVQASELESTVKQTDLKALGESLIAQPLDQVNLINPDFFKHLDDILTDKSFGRLKNWMLVMNAMSMADYLDRKTQEDAAQYSLKILGQSELGSRHKVAYRLTSSMFSDVLSVYYGQKYFTDSAKKEVTAMVTDITKTYEERLKTNTWLSQATKEKAIDKLKAMDYHVGYTDNLKAEDYQDVTVDESKSLLDVTYELRALALKQSFEAYDQPVENPAIPAFQVNAFYNPSENAIYIPAAILSAPFYDEKASQATNYGGIGAVIGHEISHAFDDNGAKYDKDGNKKNWWTKADKAAFDKKTQSLMNQWQGLTYNDVTVNAKQTVSENAADLSGVAVALQTLQTKQKKANKEDFFTSYATIYREVGYKQYYQVVIPQDVHAPAELRVNQTLKNIDDFYQVFEIDPDAPMYLPKKDRIVIW